MDAVIAAGGIPPPDDPLYPYSNGGSKALIDIAGKPMIQWVLDALSESETTERVVVVGLTDKAELTCTKPLSYTPNQGRLLENLKAGAARVLQLNPKASYILFVSSDIPAITGGMVDWVVRTCLQTHDDLYYNVIRREVMERRFPTSRRTYARLKEGELCGGDMNVARVAIVRENSEFWTRILEARKNPAAQAALLGPGTIFRYLLRRLSIDDVIRRLTQKLGIKGRAIICPYAEIGMDVDKPHQLEIVRRDLERRVRISAAGTRRARRPKTRKRTALRTTSRKPTKGGGRSRRKGGSVPKSDRKRN